MQKRLRRTWTLAVFLITLGPGCATFRSDLAGKFDSAQSRNSEADKVNVLFLLKHVRQAEGLDEIPKLDREGQIIRNFDDLFLDAMTELGNVESYATFTEFASDVSRPERRERKDELIAKSDFVVRIDLMRRHSFIRHFLAYVVSTVSLTVLPIPYSRSFSIEVDVLGADGNRLKSYQRSASLTTWSQLFLVLLQPFHQEANKKEQIYLEFLHDVFKQIEAEGVLKKG
jgi:hypothetical protein